MSLAREALNDLQATVDFVRRGPALPAESACACVARELGGQGEMEPIPPDDALARLEAAIRKLASDGRGYGGLRTREMRHAPWILWSGEPPVVALPGLLDDLVGRARSRRRMLRALVDAWLMGYAPGAARLADVAAALRLLVRSSEHPAMRELAEIDRRLRLFDAGDGPRTLARWLLDGGDEISAMLAGLGFDDPQRARSGYLRATQDALLDLGSPRLGGGRVASRLMAFLELDGELRFAEPEPAGTIARALLAPWLKAATPPSEELEGAIQTFLLRHLGDPRLRPRRWTAAGEEAAALMRRWLTKASLDAFFRLIRDHALDSHWTYREAFWRAYLEKGAITDAWLALGPDTYTDARSVKELRGAFGKVEGDGVVANHSALLMRVGDLVFCEWSHNGSLRAWLAKGQTTPRLGQPSYDATNLRQKCLPFPPNWRGTGGSADDRGLRHMGSPSGHWQGSVARLIAQRTRLRLNEGNYMPP